VASAEIAASVLIHGTDVPPYVVSRMGRELGFYDERRRHGRQLRHRPAALGDHDRSTSSGDLVHQLQALGLDHRSRNGHVGSQQ